MKLILKDKDCKEEFDVHNFKEAEDWIRRFCEVRHTNKCFIELKGEAETRQVLECLFG